ncbi:MAG: type VII secretion protein EccB [Candidatus Buchananbacteria bacterium]|nr:type VII secretion protein EccB [Candidatus Buchananbacteria bacterium]
MRHHYPTTILKLSLATVAFFILGGVTAQARTFDPSNIITDDDLINKSALSKTAIQKFLERENSVLSRYSQIVNGQTLKASEIIWQISQNHTINPKFLLTTLEKEQALVSKTQATEKALDWATGYSCYGGGCNEKHRGFYNQVDAAAETQQIYWQKAGQFNFKVGQTTKSFDGYPVTPANQATANLYIYTPYVGYSPELGVTAPYGGNRLFWRIWNRYFTDQKFLDGQILTDGSSYWLIEKNQKRKFASKEIFFQDHTSDQAIRVGSTDLAAYPDGPAVSFANNTLVKSDASGQIYLLSDGTKRAIVDNAALALLNDFRIAISENEIPTVSERQLDNYPLGSLIFSTSVYPQGKLFKDETGTIWQVKDGLKHFVDTPVWQNRFDSEAPEDTTASTLEKYPTGAPVKLKDGTFTLSTNTGIYYLISDGARMKIEDLTIFDRIFGPEKKNSALRVSTELLEAHDAGEVIDYVDDTVKDTDVPNSGPTPPAPAGAYAGTFATMLPEGLIMMTGQKQTVTVTFKNTGSTPWQQGNVWLQVTDKDKTSSTFGVVNKIDFAENSVSTSQLATFTFELAAPTEQSGLLSQEFGIYYSKNGVPTKIASIGKFVIVKPGAAAQIVEHNIPVAVRNTWRPIQITMKIQNNSTDITWLARKTALEITNDDGSTSYFHDPNDWINKTTAAAAVNKTYIKPGEIGEFKFTLDPRGIKRGNYILKFGLKLLDQNGKEIFLNGEQNWRREIRVD